MKRTENKIGTTSDIPQFWFIERNEHNERNEQHDMNE